FVSSGVKAIEMESGSVFIISQYKGVKAGALFALDGNVTHNKIKPEGSKRIFEESENLSIKIGLESLYRLAKEGIK
ncbi:MAG: nucleoside phosphorylase, partial [Caldiserica bacterium]|nr:nucleoside phosphorylase [Caldisericota bacterium]